MARTKGIFANSKVILTNTVEATTELSNTVTAELKSFNRNRTVEHDVAYVETTIEGVNNLNDIAKEAGLGDNHFNVAKAFETAVAKTDLGFEAKTKAKVNP